MMGQTVKIAILSLCSALAACDFRPDHAEWQTQCVDSHTEVLYLPVYVSDGRGGGYTQLQPQFYDQCDREARVCVAGKDGSTVCD